jgi:methionyl-tRNA formyltransferase
MRVLFAGSPAIAVPTLEVLCNTEGIQLAGVLTNPDTPRGRHGTPQPTDVGELAQELGISPILKFEKLDTYAREQIEKLNCDLLVSFAYGRIFGPKFLSLFSLGGINIHPSLLPKYRGPTPVQAAILNRDKITGITIQLLAQEMDIGDILIQEQIKLNGNETTETLNETISIMASLMLPDIIVKITQGSIQGTPQSYMLTEPSYCKLISKNDGIINWSCSALDIEAKIRAFTSWPLSRTNHNGRELIILKVNLYYGESLSKESPGTVLGIDKQHGILIQTGDGVLAVTELQYQAKKALFWREFLNGARDFLGSILG